MKRKFCILIPTYNASLVEVEKTFLNIPLDTHILVVDDGSVISFRELAGDLLVKYKNLNIIRHEKNRGIEEALEYGFDKIHRQYHYIARIDIGDSSPGERYDKQVRFLDNNPDYVMVGAWANFVDAAGEIQFVSKLPVSDSEIRHKMFINNMFIHPVVMMRSEIVLKAGGYRKKFISCEDYDLFFRMMNYGKVKNLPEVLINYEINSFSISSKKRKLQVINRIRLIINNFKFYKFGFYPYYGLIRNLLMLVISRNATTKIRKILKR